MRWLCVAGTLMVCAFVPPQPVSSQSKPGTSDNSHAHLSNPTAAGGRTTAFRFARWARLAAESRIDDLNTRLAAIEAALSHITESE